jgi:DNA-binding winged helix-turn-helix (wHTH) protein/Tol biopolymer transport system component
MSEQTKRFCEFGPFLLDRHRGVLREGERTLALPPKAFDVLLFLALNPLRVIEKAEFMSAVWPDAVVEEANLTQNVFLLRKAMDDGREDRGYIATVPGVGYRFRAEVVWRDDEPPRRRDAGGGPKGGLRGYRGLWLIGALSLIVLGLGSLLLFRRRPLLEETQLTTNAGEASLTAAAISPDGRYLAFADPSGAFLRETDAGGHTHPLPSPKGAKIYRLSFFPDGGRILATGIPLENPVPCVWTLSILGRDPIKLREDVEEAVPSPDGARILFTTRLESEIWLMGAGGEEPRRILSGSAHETFFGLSFFPDGERIAFLRSPLVGGDSAESLDLRGGKPAVIVSTPSLTSAALLSDGRLLYGVGGGPELGVGLWQVRVDLGNGRAAGSTHLVKRWDNTTIAGFTATADGKRLVFRRGNPQGDVYVGDLAPSGAALSSPRRLTLDDRDDAPSGWTPDSEAVLFHSDRNGLYDIFRQSLKDTTAEPLVEGRRYRIRPRMSPDGRFVLYYDPPGIKTWDERVRIARVPLLGGPSETVMEEQGLYAFRCARAPSTRCIAGVMHPKELVLFELDPLRGRGAEILRIPVDPKEESPNLDLSPDGETIAYVSLSVLAGHIRLLSLKDGQKRDIEVSGWASLNHVDFAADGKGLYVSSELALESSLLYVDLSGKATILVRDPGLFTETWGIPSPDGKHLAFLHRTSGDNAFMLQGF